MVLWGGLRPIPSRLALDSLTIASLFYCAVTSSADAANSAILILACCITLATAGLTKRWTISFPLLPFLFLQGLRRIDALVGWNWTIGVIIGTLSTVLVIFSALLTVLFPAVELAQVRGKYNVGVIDLHLPVDFTAAVKRGSMLGTQHQDSMDDPANSYVTARLLYPTREEPDILPYLDPECLDPKLLCSQLMQVGAPPPLKSFGWMLHNWMFTTIKAKRNAQPISEKGSLLPVAVYSHGLTGIAAIYSYQAMNLAANGMAVLMVDHTDESAIATRRRDRSHLLYNSSSVQDLMAKEITNDEYEQKRRAQTEHRVEEVLSALKVLKTLNRNNLPDLESMGVSFVNKLNAQDVTMIGHSFGACTVLAAAAREPDLVSNVIAHDPAVAWMPNEARRSLLLEEEDEEEEKKVGSSDDDDGGPLSESTIHDVNMLFLYSDEFSSKNWGSYEKVKKMHEQHGHRNPKGPMLNVGVVSKSHHSEFSDTCMLTPTWLARATGLTGERSPLDTAEEIAERTVGFLNESRRSNNRRASS